jgi:hypothetical protein
MRPLPPNPLTQRKKKGQQCCLIQIKTFRQFPPIRRQPGNIRF